MSESACFSRVPFSRGVIVLPTQTKHDMGNHPKLPYLCIVWSPPNGKFNNPCSSPSFGAAMVSNINTRAKKSRIKNMRGKFSPTPDRQWFSNTSRDPFSLEVSTKKSQKTTFGSPKTQKKNIISKMECYPFSNKNMEVENYIKLQKGKLILEGHIFHLQWLLRIRFTFLGPFPLWHIPFLPRGPRAMYSCFSLQ